jgi:hypothetical protein
MNAHSVTSDGGRRSPSRGVPKSDFVQLSWSHFWLLGSVLGWILALIGLIFLAGHSTI